MSIVLNLQKPTGFRARDFTRPPGSPFATVQVTTGDSTVDIFLDTPAECDALIVAVVEAKRMLAPGCPAMTEVETLDETVFLPCDREDGHKGSHHAEGPEEGRHVAWSDCPAFSDAATPCTSYAGHDEPHRDVNGFEWDVPLCHYCDVEPATAGDYCEACAPAVRLATGDGEPDATAVTAQAGEDDFAELPAGKTLQDLLSLAGAHVPVSAIREWNAEQFRAARDWAVAEHLHASDNDDVTRLPKPEHVTSAETAQPEASRM